MDLHRLLENIDDIREDALIESAKKNGNSYGDAAAFFKSGSQPDGGKWKDKIIPKLGFDNAPVVGKVNKKKTKNGMVYTAKLRLAPGKGGGGGVGIDPTASNHLFNLLGTDSKTINGVSKAYSELVSKHKRGLTEALRLWLKKPENFIHNIVGWKDRNKYIIGDVSFKKIRYDSPMIDPTRRKWPAGRTEIWTPVDVYAIFELSEKR